MKKFIVSFSVSLFMLVLLGVSGCGTKTTGEAAGFQDLLTVIPEKATGVFVVNLHGITQLEFFKEQMEKARAGELDNENEFFKNYMEFIDQTGLNPEKDLKSMVVALFAEPEMGTETGGNFVAVMELDYDREKMLGFINAKNPNCQTEDYQGMMIYNLVMEKDQNVDLVFLNDHAVAMGRKDNLKSVIDLELKGGKNITGNPRLKPYLDQLLPEKLLGFVMVIPEKIKESQPQGAPFEMDLTKAEILHGFIGHDGKVWSGEMTLVSKDEESNKQIVNLLNGLKGMAALGGPEVAEVVSNINLSASSDNIKLTFSISDVLLKKLQTKLKEKSSETPQPGESD